MSLTTTPAEESAGQISFDVLVDGQKLSGALGGNLQSVDLESTYNRPDVCSVVFAAPEVSAEKPLPSVKPGAAVEIRAKRTDKVKSVFHGEVSSIELDSRYGHTQYVLRAYDKRQRLYRGLATSTYENRKHSEIASEILDRNSVDCEVETAGSVMPYAVQAAMADGDYLEQLLHELGQVIVRTGDSFVVKALADFKENVAQLVFGKNLDSYTFRTTSDSWVEQVQIHDWDPLKKAAITGTSSDPAALLGDQPKANGEPFGSAPAFRAGHAVDSTGADAMATAIRERMLLTSRQLDGTCDGNENMVPGGIVTVKGVNDTFDGDYRLSSVRLRWHAEEGCKTDFTCNSASENSITDMLGRAAGGGPHPQDLGERIWGVVPAIVTKNDDPEGLGRVQVKFPWLPAAKGGQVESDWLRVAVPGAGIDQKGLYLMHEAEDEVLVAFEHGDPRRGYVLGGLYNSQDKPPLKNSDCVKGGKTPQKAFRSSTGHQLTFNDSADKPGIELVTAKKKINMTFNDTDGAVTLTTENGASTVTVSAKGDITIKSAANLKIEGAADIKMKAGANLALEAGANVDIKAGANATLEGAGVAAVKGANAELTGDVAAKVAGKIVNIN